MPFCNLSPTIRYLDSNKNPNKIKTNKTMIQKG